MAFIKTLLITEGSKTIGFGHITRCLAILEAFYIESIDSTLVFDRNETIDKLVGTRQVIRLDWMNNREKIHPLIKNTDIVIVDSYLADISFYIYVSNTAKLAVYIDDNYRLSYPKGVIINSNFYAQRSKFTQKNDSIYLLGGQYFPLRKEFSSITAKKINKKVKTIMITFGGEDKLNMTPVILDLLKKDYPTLYKKVIIGPGFDTLEEINRWRDDRTELIFNADAKKIKEVMYEADLAISASGQTLYELIRVGVPTIAIGIAYNQLNNIKILSEEKIIEYAGYWDDTNLLNTTAQLLSKLMDQNERIKKNHLMKGRVDGLGAQRIVRSILKQYLNQYVTIRKAELKDLYEIYQLSNEEEVRRNSFNPERIVFSEHKKWFLEEINKNASVFLVSELKGKLIGQTRFDLSGKKALISISINRRIRGLGVGKKMMEFSIKYLRNHYRHVTHIEARVKKGNASSCLFFETVGFKLVEETTIKNRSTYLYRFDL